MSTHRLPIPGSDDGTWGDILNDFLSQSLNADGTVKSSAVANKANTTDLATVATTGSYTDLSNKPNNASITSGPNGTIPSPSSLPTNSIYWETDVNGGTPVINTGSSWATMAAAAHHAERHIVGHSDPLTTNGTFNLPIFNVPVASGTNGSPTGVGSSQPVLYGDNVNDDAPAINYVIQQAASAGGGIVMLPQGTWYCQSTIFMGFLPTSVPGTWTTASTPTATAPGATVPTTITTRSNITLTGGGLYATKLVRAVGADIVLVDVSGTGADNTISKFARRVNIRDLNLDGGMGNGCVSQQPILRHYYTLLNEVRNVDILNGAGEGWRQVRSQDNMYYHVRVDNCGGFSTTAGVTVTTPSVTPTYPAVHLLNQEPGTTTNTQFGFTTDSYNNCKFRDLTIESYRDGALWIDGSGGFANGCNNLTFEDLKCDTTTLNGPSIVITAGLGGNYNVARSNGNIYINGLVLVPGALLVSMTGPWPAMTVQDTTAFRLTSGVIVPESSTMNYGIQFAGNNTGMAIDGLGFLRGAGSGFLGLLNFASGQNDVDILSWGLQNQGGNVPLMVGSPTGGTINRPYVSNYGGSPTNESTNGSLTGGRQAILPAGNAGDSMLTIGDTYPRRQMKPDGSVIFGAGSSAGDTTLSRTAAGVLNVANAASVTGLTGATAASRYVGATASGAPTTGTFAKGDFVVDQSGKLWVCTVLGTPGTWVAVGGGAGSSTLAGDTDVAISSPNSGQYLAYNGSQWYNTTVSAGATAVFGNGLFGDGSDGTATLDGTNTYNGFTTKSSSTYTLTRDVLATNLTINSGVLLITAGYRIYISGTFTNNGTVQNNGATSSSATGASGGTGTTLQAGYAGGTSTATAVGAAGTASTTSFGGAGGAGGLGSSYAGGAGGTSTPPAAYVGGTVVIRQLPGATTGSWVMGTGVQAMHAGAGGGAGGGDGTNAGGGGGGGGGFVLIAAKTYVNNGTINANGGAGAAGRGGNTGGGGGGGGGLVLVSTTTSSGTGTLSAAGGAGGAAVGTGVAGTSGASGTTLINVFS